LRGTPLDPGDGDLAASLGAEEFAHGATCWIAWADGPRGVLGTIDVEVAEKGLLYATRAALIGDHPAARAALLSQLDAVERSAAPERTRLGLAPTLVDAWPEVSAAGFVPAYDVLRLGCRLPQAALGPPARVVPLTPENADVWRATSNRAFFDTPNSATTSASEVASLLDDPTAVCLLLEDAGVPAGAVRLALSGDEAELEGIALVPEARGRGLGRRLLSAAARAAEHAGATRWTLTVVASNTAALTLYRSSGFTDERVVSRWFERAPEARSTGSVR
jgi:ribosomal protein S18 acetylase RimI-like enzyme